MNRFFISLLFAGAVSAMPVPEISREVLPSAQYFDALGKWAASGKPMSRTVGVSMRPYIENGDTILGEHPVASTPWRSGMILVLDEGEGRPRVCHMVEEVSKDRRYVFMEGTNHFTNLYPDGWFAVSKVSFVVVKIMSVKTS